jgi:hypothetical protein
MIPANGVQMKEDERTSGGAGPVHSEPVMKHAYSAPAISVIGNVVDLLAGDSGRYDDGVGGQVQPPPG